MDDTRRATIQPAPRGLRSVWDNGGRSIDRYTLVLEERRGANLRGMLGLSEEPTHGFSQFGECTEGSHLGRRIDWRDLPERVRAHAAERLADEG